MKETDMIIDRCEEILKELDSETTKNQKENIKLKLQTMGTIINARKTSFMIDVYNFNMENKCLKLEGGLDE